MKSQIISRILATFTVGAVVLVGASSGAFGAFSLVLKEGQTCTGYSYGYDSALAQYGWGYECNVPTPVGPGGGGGGGGGGSTGGTPMTSSTPAPTPTPTPTITPVVTPQPITPVVDEKKAELPITRAQFMKMLAEAYGYTPVDSKKRFRDVNYNLSYAQYISFGVEKGWINVRTNRFRPNSNITRGEAQKLINVIKGNAIADTVADPTTTLTQAEAVQMIIDGLGL